jgi:hypothetical protein
MLGILTGNTDVTTTVITNIKFTKTSGYQPVTMLFDAVWQRGQTNFKK